MSGQRQSGRNTPRLEWRTKVGKRVGPMIWGLMVGSRPTSPTVEVGTTRRRSRSLKLLSSMTRRPKRSMRGDGC